MFQISKVYNMLVRWHHDGPDHPKFKEHQEHVADYLWWTNLHSTLGIRGLI